MGERFVRFRISTALLLVALVGFPFAALWFRVPNPFTAETPLWVLHNWLFFDLSPILLVLAFVASLITAIVIAIRRRWRSIPQCILEMIVCLTCIIFIPAY